ncbi:MAG TPA: lysine exporter LysO family protein [Spirochaetia bacterium]|nr:lysine exporter LysO family protein [Spirochaetia bacterium]
MQSVFPLLLILFFLALGMLLGRTSLLRNTRTPGILLDLSLYALLFTMGYRIGESEAIRSQIGRVGLVAVSSALASVFGTALVVAGVMAVSGGRRSADGAMSGTHEVRGIVTRVMVHLKDPLRLFSAVIVGLVFGFVLPIVGQESIGRISTWLLYLLVLLIGLQLVRGEVDLRAALLQPRTLLVPAATIVGTLSGGLALAPLISLPLGKSLAVCAGFGWYSLSGVLITNLGDPVLGSAAFISNMLREGVSLLLIPLLGRARLGEVAIGIAGATSMDVTLPLIGRSCGGSYVPLAVANGAILSFLVPILVPLLYRI